MPKIIISLTKVKKLFILSLVLPYFRKKIYPCSSGCFNFKSLYKASLYRATPSPRHEDRAGLVVRPAKFFQPKVALTIHI